MLTTAAVTIYRASEADVVSEKGWGFVFLLFFFAHRESQ